MDHEFDCVVVGAGGAGLRAAMGLSEHVGVCVLCDVGLQDCCDHETVSYSFAHCCGPGRCECSSG